MKCHCGFEEIPDRTDQIKILYKSGVKKGQVKKIQDKFIEGTHFNSASVTLQFSTRIVQSDIKICPECKLMFLDDYIPSPYSYD